MSFVKSMVITTVVLVVGFTANRFFNISWFEFLGISAAIGVVVIDNRFRDLSDEVRFLRERVEYLEDKFGK